MKLRMKNFNIFKGSLKNPTFRGGEGSRKTNIEGGGLSKKGRLGQFTDLRWGRGGLARKRGVVFLREGGGVDTTMHTMVQNH